MPLTTITRLPARRGTTTTLYRLNRLANFHQTARHRPLNINPSPKGPSPPPSNDTTSNYKQKLMTGLKHGMKHLGAATVAGVITGVTIVLGGPSDGGSGAAGGVMNIVRETEMMRPLWNQ